jgi:hypothetical protein
MFSTHKKQNDVKEKDREVAERSAQAEKARQMDFKVIVTGLMNGMV